MKKLFKKLSAGQIIALGFVLVILIGSLLLWLPFSVEDTAEVSYIDALYTSTSAVCVTGLIAVDAGSHFTIAGRIILACLIQIGGIGVTTIGTLVILGFGKKLGLKGRNLIQESLNVQSGLGLVKLVKSVFLTTIIIEGIGAILSFIVFMQVDGWHIGTAIGVSLFHSIAAFNNSGFDIFGFESEWAGQNMIPFQDSLLLNFVTSGLIIFGGIGFLVIREVIITRFRWKKFSMHTKVVLTVSLILLVAGTLLIKFTEWNNITWSGAFFHSVSARTAGFSTYSMRGFTDAGLLVLIALMFIGASPGSTGGGIKTTTFFVLFQGVKSAATNKQEKAFHYSIPSDAFRRAAVITILAITLVLTGTFAMCIIESSNELHANAGYSFRFIDALFEVASAFGTVGLSTGITAQLTIVSKLLSILIMYIGRLGPLTVASIWHFNKGERVSYPTGNISIG